MPPLRTLIGEISGNRDIRTHLTLYIRGKITGCLLFGSSPTEVAVGLNLERSTIRYTSSLSKDPRRKSYSIVKERKLLRHVRLHPKDTYKQVKTICALICSITTIKTILKRHGITNWYCKRRLELTEAHAAKRLA
jgi:hypothetical protein